MEKTINNVIPIDRLSREDVKTVLARLYEEHHIALRRFIKVRLNVCEDREDIVQEVFARLAKIENLPDTLPVCSESQRAYIFRVANNHIIDLYRTKLVKDRYTESERKSSVEQIGEPSPERILSTQERMDQVKTALSKMKPNYRNAFILNRFHQKSYSQIAVCMGISVQSVEYNIKKAREILHAALKEPKDI